jgi:transcriptional regulator with GAF, ATPase, and Fis domain
MVATGAFREDLWFRINVFPRPIPPLRQRKEDIPELVQFLVGRKSRELGIRNPPLIAPGTIVPLQGYEWPGNVRELENVIERALIQHRGGPLIVSRSRKEPESFYKQEIVEKGKGRLILDEMIAAHIQEVLAMTRGKVNGPDGAAALLGVNPNTLRNRMKKLGVPYGRRYS